MFCDFFMVTLDKPYSNPGCVKINDFVRFCFVFILSGDDQMSFIN